MSLSETGLQTQRCPACGGNVETTGLDPFSRIRCPGCGEELRVERVFKDYVILEPLGTGGMGSVWKARDLRLNRLVALKLLRREFAGDEAFAAKLREEARITAAIKHPHVVEVFATGEEQGQAFVVMELVDGGSLDDRMESEKRVPGKEALEIGIQIAQGLEAALQAGLIHRDIKPGNILFADPQTAKIVDFGLALLAAEHGANNPEIWGTPYYVAPERLTNEPEDFRSDLYSLGATLFHALAGRPTFEEETQSAAELKRLKSNPVRLRRVAPEVSPEAASVIDQMLRPDPRDRQSSYRELIGQLRAAQVALAQGEKGERRGNWRKWIGWSLGLLFLGAAVYGSFQVRWPKPAVQSPAAIQKIDGRVDAEIERGRHELAAGRYSAAEALFAEAATEQPEVGPMVELSQALRSWERGDFDEAARGLRKLGKLHPAGSFAWMESYRPLAQERLNDYALYTRFEKGRDSAPADPAANLARARQTLAALKTKGTLFYRLRDEEATLAAEVAEASSAQAKAEKNLEAEERPRWRELLSKVRVLESDYRFDQAVDLLKDLRLRSAALAAESEKQLELARWLAEWKRELISDLNKTGFPGLVTDVHGLPYGGPIHRANENEIELRTRYGPVMAHWTNLSGSTLLTMSRAFIHPQSPNAPERQWLCAVFALQTGQTAAANELFRKAKAADGKYRALRERYFLGGKTN